MVDSEDIPLSISRESMQDSSLLQRVRDILTRKLLRFFDEKSRKDKKKYGEFIKEYSQYFKEAVVTDQTKRYHVSGGVRARVCAREEEAVGAAVMQARKP